MAQSLTTFNIHICEQLKVLMFAKILTFYCENLANVREYVYLCIVISSQEYFST